jgi:lysophospholipase L1-like esterase
MSWGQKIDVQLGPTGQPEYYVMGQKLTGSSDVTAITDPVTGRIRESVREVFISDAWDVTARKLGHVGDRCCCLVNTPSWAQSATTYTWSLAAAIPADAIAVQIISINGQAYTPSNITGAVSVGATKTEQLNNAGAWTNATWSGASTVTMPAGTQANPTFTLSDWIPITPAASTFNSSAGLPLQMCYARIATPSTNTSVSLAGYTGSNTAWGTIADNNVRIALFQAGDFVASPSGMTGASDPQNAPIVGIRYMTATANVVNVMALGDSIEFGAGATIFGNSFGHIACNSLSKSNRIYSFNNQGYSGQSTAAILARAKVLIPQFKPQIVIFPAFSPNDGTPTQAIINAQLANIRQISDLCLRNGAMPIVLQGLPKTTDSTNTTSAFTAPQDAFRVALNALNASGAIVYVNHGLGNSASPELFGSSSYTSDGTHPSDVGNTLLSSPIQAAILASGF